MRGRRTQKGAGASSEARDYNNHKPQRLEFLRRQVSDPRGRQARLRVTWCWRVTWESQVTVRGGRTDCGADGGRRDVVFALSPLTRAPPSLPP